ncbi:hypothetical protein D918_06867 [Trichuris suis]|nr:hypothetical protein D918_06867 [Trichuris suis]
MLHPFSLLVSFGLWMAALPYCGAERYFGRFIGLLAEGRFTGSKYFYSCRGLVWVPDKYRFAVSAFTFQPPLEATKSKSYALVLAAVMSRNMLSIFVTSFHLRNSLR